MTATAGATSGRMERGEHVMPLRVYYEDTDAAGIVYYANYLKFAERARTEMLRLAGIEQTEMAAAYGMAFAVRDCTVSYAAPARLDDLLEVRSRLTEFKGATLRAEQEIRRGPEHLARLGLRVACVTLDGRPARIPAAVRQALQSYVSTS